MAKKPTKFSGNMELDELNVTGNSSLTGTLNVGGVLTAPVGKLTCSVATAAKELTAAEQLNSIFVVTGHATNTLTLGMPDNRIVIISAVTTGVLVKNKADGTAVTIAADKSAIVYTSGDNVIRVSADA